MKDLDDRYGHPEFKTIIPICAVCKNFADGKCLKDEKNFYDYQFADNFDCPNVIIDENSDKLEWWNNQQNTQK